MKVRMYGFRGKKANVDFFSPFEMLRYWALVKVTPPNKALTSRSQWTPAGRKYAATELDKGNKKPAYIAGLHYVAVDAEHRILLPEHVTIEDPQTHKKHEVLRNLRHAWCWEKRSRPYVPVWSKSKMPDRRWSPEENSRLLCLYMRPWTLAADDQAAHNPLLSNLASSHLIVENATSSEKRRDGALVAHPSSEDATKSDCALGARRVPADGAKPSYAGSWEWYVNGNVVSELNRRFIVNLLGSTTARALDMPDDSDSDDSDDDGEPDDPEHVGNMDLVQRTMNGMWANSEDDGILGFGRHSESIRLGRNLWQSAALTDDVRNGIREDMLEATAFPSGKDIKREFARLQKADEVRPAPFDGRTQPYASLTVHQYGQRIDTWFVQLREQYVEHVFAPGELGATLDAATGEIRKALSVESYTNMTASRVEYNIRSDWDLLPGMWTLNFASQVNTMVSLSLQRCLQRGAGMQDRITDRDISLATERIYNMLWQGECEINGQRVQINGDLSKLPHAVGLTPTELALLRNYHFMSSMIAGTRQVRRKIRHLLFSSLVVYGTPVFLTFSPSERHSGVAIHLYRGRRNGPAYNSPTHDAKDFKKFVGYSVPSSQAKVAGVKEGDESIIIEHTRHFMYNSG